MDPHASVNRSVGWAYFKRLTPGTFSILPTLSVRPLVKRSRELVRPTLQRPTTLIRGSQYYGHARDRKLDSDVTIGCEKNFPKSMCIREVTCVYNELNQPKKKIW